MATKPNDVEEDATTVRTSVSLPSWMDQRLEEIAERTFSSKSQVVRRFVAHGIEREDAGAAS